jgi:hypothetical protein
LESGYILKHLAEGLEGKRLGPALWTGGRFGPEAGLVGFGGLVLGSLLILPWVCLRQDGLKLDR